MKKIFFIAFSILLLKTSVSAQATSAPGEETKMKWYTIEEAMAAAVKSPRKIMIDVYTKWCGPCKMMSQNTFTDPKFIEYMNANYYCVKFDAESPEPVTFNEQQFTNPDYDPNKQGRNGVHQFARYLNVGAYPTLVFLEANGGYIGPVVGYKTTKDLEIFVKFFAEDKHKVVLTQEQWTEYQKTFVGSW